VITVHVHLRGIQLPIEAERPWLLAVYALSVVYWLAAGCLRSVCCLLAGCWLAALCPGRLTCRSLLCLCTAG
jgi:hypothetical protein